MEDPIQINTQQGFVSMITTIEGIEVHGLASMALENSHILRKPDLTDIDMEIKFAFDQIFLNGTYKVQSGFGWYVIPGNFFSIGMTRCTLTYTSKMELVDVTR